MKKLISIIIAIFVISSVYASTGGTPINYEDFPYLSITAGDRCLASFINSNTAITAAHCTIHLPAIHTLYTNMLPDIAPLPITVNKLFTNNLYDDSSGFNMNSVEYDVGLVTIKDKYSFKTLSIDPKFDPYAYISSQPGEAILFRYFGLESSKKLQINSAILSLMSGDKCAEQINDLLENEGSKFGPEVAEDLTIEEKFLTQYPQSIFCSFIKKSDPIQSTPGDSGGPLIINYNNKPTLAGINSAGESISASQNYTEIEFFTNIANSYDFLKKCQSQQSGLINGVEDSPSCETLQQWWEQHRINSNENMFAIPVGLARMVPDSNDVNSMMLIPYFIGIGNLFN